jgi:integrase
MSGPKHAGGRPRGTATHNNDGIFKYCSHRSKWAKCRHSWFFNFRYNGTNHRFSLNKHFQKPRGYWMAKSEAEALRDSLRAQIRAGTFNGASPTATPEKADSPSTLREVATLYHDACGADPNRRAHRLPILRQSLDVLCRTVFDGQPFGDKSIDAVVTADLEKFRAARRTTFRAEEARLAERRRRIATGDETARKLPVSPELPHARNGETGINRSLELLRKLCFWAIEHGYRTSESPFTKHGRPCFKFAREQGRDRRLRPGEEERFRQHADAHLLALFEAALETGMRREEALSLQWKDVVLNAKGQPRALMLRAETTKTAKPRTIPISQTLRALVEMRRNGPDGEPLGPEAHVFGSEIGEHQDSIKTAWRTTCRKAGIEDLHFHDLRREAASRWLEAGVALLTVSYLLGHAQVTTTNAYSASSDVVAERELLAFQRRQRLVAKSAGKSKPGATVQVH